MERTTTPTGYGPTTQTQFNFSRFRWGAVFAGAFVAVGIWVLLYSLGLAIGLSSIDPNNPRSVGLGTGIYSLVVPLIALFLGGLVAARVSGPMDRVTGAMHGAVLWGLTTVAGILTVGMLVGTLVSGLGKAGSAAGSAAAQGISSGQLGSTLGLSANDLVGPINEKLRAEGKPQVTADQLQATVQQAAKGMLRGNFDRNSLAAALSRNTQLSQQDAQDIVSRIQQGVGGAGEQIQSGAVTAANVSGKAFWGIFFSLLLGLVASVLGATAGVARSQREAATAAAGEPLNART